MRLSEWGPLEEILIDSYKGLASILVWLLFWQAILLGSTDLSTLWPPGEPRVFVAVIILTHPCKVSGLLPSALNMIGLQAQ